MTKKKTAGLVRIEQITHTLLMLQRLRPSKRTEFKSRR